MNKIIHRYCLMDKSSIKDLCQKGDLLIIYKRDLIVKDQQTFRLICERGYINLVKKSTEKCSFDKNDFRYGMIKACRRGHREIVNLMITLLSNNGNINVWNSGLANACYGGHRDIVDLMITLLENNGLNNNESENNGLNNNGLNNNGLNNNGGVGNWSRGLANACLGGHREIVDLMIEKGANDWNQGLAGACQEGHRDIIKLMIEKVLWNAIAVKKQ